MTKTDTLSLLSSEGVWFMFAAFFALYGTTPINSIAYIILLSLSWRSARSIMFTPLRFAIPLILLSVLYYLLRFPVINAISLWLDEANVLLFARASFDQATARATMDIMAPPLNYWGIWLAREIITSTPPQIMEFVYRIPTMITHIAASLVFTATVLALNTRISPVRRPKNDPFLLATELLAFSTYFFMPLLLAYSLDLRFYAFMTLGVNVLLYLAVTNQLYEQRSIPILMLFLLNAVPHWLVLFPFGVYAFMKYVRQGKVNYFVWVVTYVSLMTFLFPGLRFSFVPGNPLPFIAQQMQTYVFPTPITLGAVLILWYIAFRTKHMLFLPWLLLALVVSMAGYTMATRYFDLGARHFLHILPLGLLVLFIPLLRATKRAFVGYALIISFLCTLPWVLQSEQVINERLFLVKTSYGPKEVFSASHGSYDSVILLADGTNGVYANESVWYAEVYRMNILVEPSEQRACAMLARPSKTILIRMDHDAPCSGYGFVTRYNSYGYPILSYAKN